MQKTVRIAGMAHSKLRNAVGLVGIEADPVEQLIYVRMAKHWDRKDLNIIASDTADLWDKAQWSQTIIDQMVGEHVIQGLRRASGLPIRIIFQKKKVLDPGEIRRVKTLDIVEMTQYMLQLKLVHRIKFPDKPTQTMQELEHQVALYSEHSTEQGQISYYAPGDELDNLTKGLIIACFGARAFLQDSVKIVGGPIPRANIPRINEPGQIFSQIDSVADITTSRGFRKRRSF